MSTESAARLGVSGHAFPADCNAASGRILKPGSVCASNRPAGPVIYALMKYEFVLIYPINPRSLADFRRAFTVCGAKSDPRDGDLLCEFGAKHHDRLVRWNRKIWSRGSCAWR